MGETTHRPAAKIGGSFRSRRSSSSVRCLPGGDVMTTTAKEASAAIEPYLEPGEAFRRLGGLESPAVRERYDVVVIGGGQAGLSVGYYLRKRGLRFLILDASERVGDVWRKRWDSLRVFTPARYSSLDGLPFPAAPYSFPTKDAMGDYLEAYARNFQLPVRCGVRVERLSRLGERFL